MSDPTSQSDSSFDVTTSGNRCPDTPAAFFDAVAAWAADFKSWADDVDGCFNSTCGTQDRRKELQALCRTFCNWAAIAKLWADPIEDCYQSECGPHTSGDHTKPPAPPF